MTFFIVLMLCFLWVCFSDDWWLLANYERGKDDCENLRQEQLRRCESSFTNLEQSQLGPILVHAKAVHPMFR